MDKGIIGLFVEIIEGERRIKKIRVWDKDANLIETIINDDRKKDLTHLNQYIGKADVRCYFNGQLQFSGGFVKAGFNEEGNTMIEFYEEEVFTQ
ncbi:hypothetical protein BSK59_15910 [Paenibacillus odorifer]|uniref:hypothetical protein n=1 Tax=Paenibacillus odorifer TaxID=189426 RepID=UPI00096DDB71|nr:hypothetical protein [Paenibacillus odorifer]OME54065.1 hypothetical protein BSK59_15910 [Paenibacillus odorifer]